MHKSLIALGIAMIILAGPIHIVINSWLSEQDVPSITEIGEDLISDSDLRQSSKDVGLPFINFVKKIEKIPLIFLLIGAIILAIGLVIR